MKKLLFIVTFIITSIACLGQGQWQASTARYTDNGKYYFHWNLDKDLEWERVQGNERHTVFAALSPFGLYAFVNITEAPKGVGSNIQDSFEAHRGLELHALEYIEKRDGGKGHLLTFRKCKFAGHYAINSVVKVSIEDDIVNEEYYGIKYSFLDGGNLWQVTIKCSVDVWEAIGGLDGVKELFSGFGFNYKPNK